MVSNSDYLDPDGFANNSAFQDLEFPKNDDVCATCGIEDSNSNWLIYHYTSQQWICERCIDTQLNTENPTTKGEK